MGVFFFFFIHDDVESIFKRLDERRNEIAEKYGCFMPVPNFDITTIRAVDYYEYCCCEMMEDPEYFLYEGRDVTTLPDSVQDFNRITDRLHNELRSRCTGPQIGQRLRAARKESDLTGEKVVQLWAKQYDENNNHCTTTQATVSNHERGKVASIKLIDLLRYSIIYNKVTSPDEIMFGCTYTELLNNEAAIKPVTDPMERERMLTGDSYLEQIRKMLILLSDGKCELCGKNAPFSDKEDFPYLRLKAVTEEDGVTLSNAVVLCPNCYAQIEVLNNPEDYKVLQKKASDHSFADLYKHMRS